MTISEVANRLVKLCRTGQWDAAQDELFAAHAVSIEPIAEIPDAVGIEAIKAKGKNFEEMVEEMYGGEVSDPIIADDYFSVVMSMDVKYKGQERRQESEVIVYGVENGKIISEQFFYKGGL